MKNNNRVQIKKFLWYFARKSLKEALNCGFGFVLFSQLLNKHSQDISQPQHTQPIQKSNLESNKRTDILFLLLSKNGKSYILLLL